jgi:transaldolase
MQFFLDTGLIDEIKEASQWGLIDGVTTNPSLIAKTGRNRDEVIREICGLIDGPISAEVVSLTAKEMTQEGIEVAKIHPNIVVKLPLTEDGIIACHNLSQEGIKTNVTLCFSVNQALLAAKNGATYISPFIGRLDDIGNDGMNLITEIKQVYANYNMKTQILGASVRHSEHVRQLSLVGCDVATMPFKVVKSLFQHPLTKNGLEAFMKDHQKANS